MTHPSLDLNDLFNQSIERVFGLVTTELILNSSCCLLLLQFEHCPMMQQVQLLAVEFKHLLGCDTPAKSLIDIAMFTFSELVHKPNNTSLSCCLPLPFDYVRNFLRVCSFANSNFESKLLSQGWVIGLIFNGLLGMQPLRVIIYKYA